MNAKEAEAYIYASYLKAAPLQDYAAPDAEKRRPDLSAPILRELSGTPATVITGSKGKGSTACMLSALLGTHLRVGMMTSPHLQDFCERFRVSGRMISPEALAACVEAVKPQFDEIEKGLGPGVCISPMGIQTAAALAWFRREGTQFNVLECGKGARYDDVPRAAHRFALIGPVFAEHTRELGPTPEAIAADKAYVMHDCPEAFMAAQSGGADRVLREAAAREGTRLYVGGEDFYPENVRFTPEGMIFDAVVFGRRFAALRVPLLGEHQARNGALALAHAVAVLPGLSGEEARAALETVSWPARMEVLGENPFILLDNCVNRVSALNVRAVLDELKISRVTAVIGIPDDKDYAGVARVMSPAAERIILTKPANPHYRASGAQAERLRREGMPAVWHDDVPGAIDEALGCGLPVVVLGTGAMAGEARTYIRGGR